MGLSSRYVMKEMDHASSCTRHETHLRIYIYIYSMNENPGSMIQKHLRSLNGSEKISTLEIVRILGVSVQF